MARIKGLTLIELILAISLLGVIIAAPVTLELFFRRQSNIYSAMIKLSQEGAMIINFISNYVNSSVGDTAHNAVAVSSGSIRVRTDPNITPSDFSDDVWVEFRRVGNNLLFYPDVSNPSVNEILSSHVVPDNSGFSITTDATGQYRINISLRLRNYPSSPADVTSNPEINICTSICSNYPLS